MELKKLLEDTVADLEDKAMEGRRISQEGSPATSMAEESTLGILAVEQHRIVEQLKAILKLTT